MGTSPSGVASIEAADSGQGLRLFAPASAAGTDGKPTSNLTVAEGGGGRRVPVGSELKKEDTMSRLSINETSRRVHSPAQWIAVATFLVFGLSAATASAAPQLIEICQKGHTIRVDVHAVPALLEQGARLGSCEGEVGCSCSFEFDPVTLTCANDGYLMMSPMVL